MALTCDRCLNGDAQRCRRGTCAAWARGRKAFGRPKPPRPTTARPRTHSGGGRPGRPTLGTPEERQAIAESLYAGMSQRKTAALHGVPWGRVQSISRQLRRLS